MAVGFIEAKSHQALCRICAGVARRRGVHVE
jgi:hypothetical protein